MNARQGWISSILGVLLLMVSTASATVMRNDRFPIEQYRINDCTGGYVVLNGVMHLQERLTTQGLIETQINVHWTGTGSDGNAYVLNSQHKNERMVDDPIYYAQVWHDRLISKGSAPNRHVLIRSATTPPHFEFTLDCRG